LEPGVTVEGWVHHAIKGERVARMAKVLFSADDQFLAVMRMDNSIHIWNTRTGEHVRRFSPLPQVHPDCREIKMAMDPSNRYFAIAQDALSGAVAGEVSKPAVVVWELKTGKEVLRTEEGVRVESIGFSPNGDLIYCQSSQQRGGDLTLGPGRITIRNAADFSEARSFYTPGGATCFAIVPGLGIATGDCRGQVMLWRVQPARLDDMYYFPTGRLLTVTRETGEGVVSIAISQDGTLLAASDMDYLTRVWKIVSPPPSAQSREGKTAAESPTSVSTAPTKTQPNAGTK
jgi:WD40 repeat protein